MLPDSFDLGFRLLVGAVVGLILGSFTTVLLWRVPRGESIVHPPSHCPVCQTRLGVRDLVPLVSWILNAGQCRHCQSRISVRYPILEGVMMALSMTAWGILGWTWSLVFAMMVMPFCVAFMGWLGARLVRGVKKRQN